MMDIVSVSSVLAAVSVVSVVYLLWSNRRPPSLPPGPPHIPFIGSIFSMTDKLLHRLFMKWSQIYGPVFTFSLGNSHMVVLGDYQSIKEGLVTLGTDLAGRADLHGALANKLKAYSITYPTMGIIDSTYSEEWKKQRNVALQIMRSLGYGKHAIEMKISEEAVALRDIIRKEAGQATDPEHLLGVSVANVICSMLYGDRYEHSDAEFKGLIETLLPLLETSVEETAADFIPLLRLRPAYHRNMAKFRQCCRKLNEFNQEKIMTRKARLDEEGYDDPRDFIECYLKELRYMNRGKLEEDWLPTIVNDFFVAGAETTATTLHWTLLWMALNPELQKKVQSEIDRVFGCGPHEFCLSDREKLPYIEATIMEIQRRAPIVPTTIPHTAMQDITLNGFTIPKGTEVLGNIYAVLLDSEIWPEPDKLKPERFLDAEGNLVRVEQWIPFSMGRRACLGEQLARQELFIFFTTLIHSFTVSMPKGAPLPDLDGRLMGVWKPPQYEVVFTWRFE